MNDLGEVSIHAAREGFWGTLESVLLLCAVAIGVLLPLFRITWSKWAVIWPHPSSSAAHRRTHRAAGKHLLTHDVLTALPNRLLLEDRMHQAMLQADRRKCRFAAMVLSLERFKSVNDSLGRDLGDRLLVEVAQRLLGATREMDTLARHACDEFVLLATDVSAIEDVHIVVEKIMKVLSQPVLLGVTEIYPDASVGVSVYPDDGSDAISLLLHAEAAMLHAKQLGGRQAQFFAPAMNDDTLKRFELTNDLRRAVGENQLVLHYQPKLEIATGIVRGVEALLRWQHPTRGMLLPELFMPMAQTTGTIYEISEWVLAEACRQAAAWQHSDGLQLRVAAKLSVHQFKHDLPTQVRRALANSQLQPGLLKLELSESSLIQDPERAAAALRELREIGVCTSVGDFGVNCSSLSYLRRFPLDELKIDRSFIAGVPEDSTNGAIVRAIMALAHGLGLKVVAEGVETLEQLNFLTSLGCDKYQGSLCCEPLSAQDLANFVRDINASLAAEELRLPDRKSAPFDDRAPGVESRPHG